MASAGFGRKAIAAAPSPDAELAARREAFLAAERARRASEGEGGGGSVGTGSTGYGKARAAPVGRVDAGPFYVREKSLATAYLLWFFLGGFSAHRFYLGYTASGAIQLFLRLGGALILFAGTASKSGGMGGLGLLMFAAGSIWMLIDGFLIPGMRREANRPALGTPAYVFS
jgi:TM2 domain-containing membrane protein YozV